MQCMENERERLGSKALNIISTKLLKDYVCSGEGKNNQRDSAEISQGGKDDEQKKGCFANWR